MRYLREQLDCEVVHTLGLIFFQSLLRMKQEQVSRFYRDGVGSQYRLGYRLLAFPLPKTSARKDPTISAERYVVDWN